MNTGPHVFEVPPLARFRYASIHLNFGLRHDPLEDHRETAFATGSLRRQIRAEGCGGMEKLQYDHLIQVDKGGASTVENVQILYADCNSKKGNRIDELPF